MASNSQEQRNEEIRKRMLNLSKVHFGPLPPDSPWIRPVRMHYTHDGREKIWDLLRAHDSVGILVFNVTCKKLIFVRQFRPAVYYAYLPEKHQQVDLQQYPPSLGLTLELCAGNVDKDKPLVEIAREELLEECGYEAPTSAFTQVISYRSVSSQAARQTLFYVEVTDDMNTHPGGGADSEGELIEVVYLSVQEVKDYMNQDEIPSPATFLSGVSWFLANKQDRYA